MNPEKQRMAMNIYNWILGIVIFTSSFCYSCETNSNNESAISIQSHFDKCNEFNETPNSIRDTIYVKTVNELKNQLRSNRVLFLESPIYRLESTLQLYNINNLKIIGNKTTRLMIDNGNSTVLKLSNLNNFLIENVVVGHSENKGHLGEQGIIRIENSSYITIKNCSILGAGTFGLITKNTCGLSMKNSEITKCTGLIFELNKSKDVEFKNTKFHNNKLAISVLAGFTHSTKRVTFENCIFLNNTPKTIGNPAFNFDNNYQFFEEKIIFKNCTFKNNVGYKWYGDKIELQNCKVDSTDFIGFK